MDTHIYSVHVTATWGAYTERAPTRKAVWLHETTIVVAPIRLQLTFYTHNKIALLCCIEYVKRSRYSVYWIRIMHGNKNGFINEVVYLWFYYYLSTVEVYLNIMSNYNIYWTTMLPFSLLPCGNLIYSHDYVVAIFALQLHKCYRLTCGNPHGCQCQSSKACLQEQSIYI